jgi:hypothetical protein
MIQKVLANMEIVVTSLMVKKNFVQLLIYSKQPFAICGVKESAMLENVADSHTVMKIFVQRIDSFSF